jgi:hypothetical protein
VRTLTYILWGISQHLDAREQGTIPVVDGRISQRLYRQGRRRQKRRRRRCSNFLNVSAERGQASVWRRWEHETNWWRHGADWRWGTEATEGPGRRTETVGGVKSWWQRDLVSTDWWALTSVAGSFRTGDTNAKLAEAVDNQCVTGREQS